MPDNSMIRKTATVLAFISFIAFVSIELLVIWMKSGPTSIGGRCMAAEVIWLLSWICLAFGSIGSICSVVLLFKKGAIPAYKYISSWMTLVFLLPFFYVAFMLIISLTKE